jgi:para-aminobenzoate synthetase/4-amino-4-deoxychorismate lyase
MEKPSKIISGSDIYALLEDSKSSPSESRNLLFTDPKETIIARSEAEIEAALIKIDKAKNKGLYLCGYVAYEAAYYFIDKKIDRRFANHSEQPLLHFIAFKSVTTLDRKTIDAAFAEILIDKEGLLCVHDFKLNVSKNKYLDAIKKIKRYIIAGDTYQINYTIKYTFKLLGNVKALYGALRKTQPVEFGALLNFPDLKIVSLSPELFVRKKGNTLISKPMKGTAKRGLNKKEDQFIVDFLKNDPKTLSENVMIVDLIRNDFGRICKTGSVVVKNLFEVQTFKTIHQMISTVKGKLKSNISLSDLFHGLFPCGSITGAPKIRTMEIINELENEARGIYTGAIGYIFPNNDLYFNVPIRTIVIDKKQCEMGIGSGIIYESNAKAEFEECLLKADFLTSLNQEFYLIETFKYDAENHIFKNIEQHLIRLKDSARYFGFKLKQFAINHHLSEIKKSVLQGEHKIRLTAYQNGVVKTSHEEIFKDDGEPKIIVLGNQNIDSTSIFQFHKTSRRDVYNQEYDKASKAGYYDAVILNERNEVAEACRHNIFIKKDGQLITPPLTTGILNGIYRQKLIMQEQAIEKTIYPDDLINCDEILLTNSVRGIVHVKLKKLKRWGVSL